MLSVLKNLFSSTETKRQRPNRPHLFFDRMPAAIYAVGDIHGCIDPARSIEAWILSDGSAIQGEKWIVYLGDHVDRGPSSAAVLDMMLSPLPQNFRRICLAGNHEELMLSFIDNPSTTHDWLNFGGSETLASYGLYDLQRSRAGVKIKVDSHIPQDHIDFLRGLPSLLSVPGFCFVHAGLREGVSLDMQNDGDLLWSRPDPKQDDALDRDFTVVHGHTPVETTYISRKRINVDTGAYIKGVLSGVKITADRPPQPIRSN